MSEMEERTVEMADGCPERAVIDISRGELRTGAAGLLLAIVQAIIFF